MSTVQTIVVIVLGILYNTMLAELLVVSLAALIAAAIVYELIRALVLHSLGKLNN